MLNWIKPKTATLPELREQRVHASSAHIAACEATVTAQRAFDDDGSPAAQKALLAAQDAERSAHQHFLRAERLVASAEELRKAEEVAELGRKLKANTDELASDPVSDDLVKREIAALEAVSDARVARFEHNIERSNLRAEQRRLREALGLQVEPVGTYEPTYEPSPVPVRDALLAIAKSENPNGAKARYLRELAR